MAEKLGDAVLYLKTDDTKYKSGLKTAHTGAKTLDNQFQKSSKSLLQMGANITMIATGIIRGFQAIGRAITGLMEKYNRQALAEKQLEARLISTKGAAGLTKQEILGMASAMQQLTTFGDEAVIEGQNMLLTFTKIGKETFPHATEAMLDFAQATGVNVKQAAITVGKLLNDPQGMAAAKRMGISFTDAQRAMAKSLFETGRVAEYQQLILQELNREFGGSAKAARDTFGGAMKALGNVTGDVQETMMGYIANVGRPFVENMIESTKGLNEFLKSEEGIKRVASVLTPLVGIFGVGFEIISKLVDMIFKFTDQAGKDITDAFHNATSAGSETNIVFAALGGIMQGVGVGFAIAGKIINLVVTAIADLIKVAQASVDTLAAFGTALFDPFNKEKWEEVGKNAEKTLNAFATLTTNAISNYGDVITQVIDEFKDFGKGATDTAKDLQKSYEDSAAGVANALNNMNFEFKNLYTGINEGIDNTDDNIEDKTISIIDNFKKVGNALKKTTREFKNMAAGAGASMDELNSIIEEVDEKARELANTITGFVGDVIVSMGEAIITGAEGWEAVAESAKNAIVKVLQAIGEEAAVQAVIHAIPPPNPKFNPVVAGLFGAASILSFATAGIIKALAQGGTLLPGEIGIVGERGEPELLTVAQPTRVTPANQMRGIIGDTYNLTINTDRNLTGLEQANIKLMHRWRSATR